MKMKKVDFDLMFETSWEVCNKVGGIYTVLSTKAKTLQKHYKDKVIFIGPDVWTSESPSPYFIECETPLKKALSEIWLPEGMHIRSGRWDIPGEPLVILVSFEHMYAVKDELYGRMWQLYGVDSLHAYGDYDEACAFSHAAGIVITELSKAIGIENGKSVIAHFDEWTTGMGLLFVKDKLPQVATVFTTHATCIGRSISGNNKPLYDYLQGYNGDQMAQELNMQSKHSLEKAAALNADCFTTVSDITARECEQLLGRKPDVVTPNGFELNFVPTKTQYPKVRKQARKRMLEVAEALTANHYDDDTFIVITSGRCEYHNKGIDLYLDAMRRMADNLGKRRVLSFVMVPAWMKEPRVDLMESIGFKHEAPLSDPVITHTLNNPESDAILSRIHGIGFNTYSNLTMIYVPCYLNGSDGIFDLKYYQILPGVDATVFPSYYEPWGYTPLESVAFGVPTITTSLSGFGQWILSDAGNSFESSGVRVEERGDYNYDQVKDAISADLLDLYNADAAKTKAIAEAARETSKKASWEYFIDFYDKAYEIALNNAHKRFQETIF